MKTDFELPKLLLADHLCSCCTSARLCFQFKNELLKILRNFCGGFEDSEEYVKLETWLGDEFNKYWYKWFDRIDVEVVRELQTLQFIRILSMTSNPVHYS